MRKLFASLAVLTIFIAPAVASTVTFGSYAGSNPGFSNTATTYVVDTNSNNLPYTPPQTSYYCDSASCTAGNAYTVTNAYYPPAFTGTSFVSFEDLGVTTPGTVNAGTGNTTYSTTFAGNSAMAGTLSVYGDDSIVGVDLNGTPLTAGSAGTFLLPLGDFVNGVNTISIVDFNQSGPTAIDFSGTASGSPAATPEPSSLVLLGTGILSAAGLARRRLLKA